jgi:hypothetical protein
MHRLLRALYGQTPTLRGAGLLNGYVKLRKLGAEGQDCGDAKEVFNLGLLEETEEVLSEYDLFLHEHVENTRAARIAAMAPSHAQWAAIIRQSNALHRQMERKIRLLEEMQERRRKMGSATDLLSRLAGLYDPSGDAGGRPAPTTPGPSSPEEGSLDPGGVAHTSRCSESGCMRLPPQTGKSVTPTCQKTARRRHPCVATARQRQPKRSSRPRLLKIYKIVGTKLRTH